MKKIYCIVLVILILTLQCLNVSAVELNNDSLNNMKHFSIDTSNLLKKEEKLSKEEYKSILKSVGYSETIINSFSDEDIELLFENVINIETQVGYFKVNSTGEVYVISEEKCMNEVNSISSNNDGWEANTSDDGYMRMTISCAYLEPSSQNNEKGWYMFYTWYEWLIIPKNRLNDALSVASSSFDWLKSSDWLTKMYYNATDANGNSFSFDGPTKTIDDLTVEREGFYYTRELPLNDGNFNITYIQIFSQAKCRIFNYNIYQPVTVHVKYVHAKKALSGNAKYEWANTGKIGVKLDNILVSKTDYYFYTDFSYNP